MLSALFKADSLRTVMLLSSVKKIEAHKFPYGLYFRSLRAFDAGWTNLTNIELSCLLSLIVGSKHLRYLNLSGTMIRFLPESICSLQSLQTLDVSNCRDLEKLPEHMSRIRSLRHLYIEGCPLNHIPPNIGKLSCLRSLCRFIVNRRRGCGIDELGSLLNLEGRVRIEHLEKVKSPTEAKKANLAGKMNLKRLTLEWGLNESTESYKKKTAQVLEALEPPPGLEFLRIDSFSGMRFPGWFSNNDAIFQNLDSIEFFDCKNCSELPTGMGKLPSLTYLGMYRMDCLRYVDDESESFGTGELEGAGYLQLQKLRISCLTSLERLSRSRMERRDIFPRLSSLNIEGCPKLTSLHCLQSIRELSIKGCSETVLESVSNLHTLTSLEIWNNDDLASFPDGFLHNLTALKSLKISRFTKLQDLQSDMLIGLTALEELSIYSCDMFECFSTGTYRGLISLKNMQIVNCRKLKSLSDNFGDLPALESLRISKCPELETFPSGLNNLSSLQRLTLSESKLTALPENLQHLPALKGWMKLQKSIFSFACRFPNGHNNLSSVQYLSLSGYHDPDEVLPDWLGNLSLFIISKRLSQGVVSTDNTEPQESSGCLHFPYLRAFDAKNSMLTSISYQTHIPKHLRKGCYIDELGSLNLGGNLSIQHLEKAKCPVHAKKADLKEINNLKSLHLSLDINESDESQEITERVLKLLNLPQV
ncbi:hypothetical protein FEM48_Zijuj11G0146700 [Ziziphus jujuba var. spinosa]|uniref:R13L1/DRL21-like LRR repeat region domain-containing protein n=1 Tax=Ziziphus jujuba var. spinosa TaxID=714518 RepID=A0A978UJI9_ZIZJJ|nr:hypothetical protein FEM48_Zijuj11G0146700 [Ziziphus jujuba var. spinosa]